MSRASKAKLPSEPSRAESEQSGPRVPDVGSEPAERCDPAEEAGQQAERCCNFLFVLIWDFSFCSDRVERQSETLLLRGVGVLRVEKKRFLLKKNGME